MTSEVAPLRVVTMATMPADRNAMPVALFDSSGNPVSRILDEVPSGAEVVLTGFTSGSAGALAATDTVNEAFGKLQARTLSAAPTGGNVVLTGYTSGSAGSVAATDTANEAIAKLEARIAALEGA